MSRFYYSGSDTIRKFEVAAESRFTEAASLYTIHKLTAVYLFGYAIEMWVKNAVYKVNGFPPTRVIGEEDRDRVSAAAPVHGIAIQGQHDFLGWANLFVALKSAREASRMGPPGPAGYTPALGREFATQAGRASLVWRPGLRYSAYEMDEADAREVREPAEWFRDNYKRINS